MNLRINPKAALHKWYVAAQEILVEPPRSLREHENRLAVILAQVAWWEDRLKREAGPCQP